MRKSEKSGTLEKSGFGEFTLGRISTFLLFQLVLHLCEFFFWGGEGGGLNHDFLLKFLLLTFLIFFINDFTINLQTKR